MTITESETEEWIEKVVSRMFDELLVGISSKTKLHPTEQVNRDGAMAEYSNMKIYDFINSYHAYCKLCEQHFYSRSVASDINSFFQKHLNTSYHRQIREVYPPSDETPIFTWEKKFYSGRCNLCDFSNLNSYIIDTEFDLKKLMKLHICFWDQESRETNERVLRKLNLLKKYCGLKIFREKFIKKVNEREVCLLCRMYIPWSGEKVSCHLSSDIHYQNFCGFLRIRFNFLPKDVLNGFNLEVITRWLISNEASIVSEFTDFDEKKICLYQSNSEENPYSEEKGNYSFSTKLIERLSIDEKADFIHKNKCLLCDKIIDLKHWNSKLHLSKAADIDKTSFDEPEKYLIFCRNREKRIRMIQKYKRLESGLENLYISPKKGIKRSPEPSTRENYFMTLIKKKMNLVSYIFTVLKNGEAFCQICDHYLPSDAIIKHLTSSYHISQQFKWKELMRHFTNERFIEPFQKFKNLILCLVCGAVFDPNSFFSHIKGGTHSWRFEWYINQKESTPICSSFAIREDFLCFCTQCNTSMNKGLSLSPIKTMVQNIRRHWPCPNVKEKKANLSNELKIIFEINKTAISKNLNLVQEMSVPCSTCGRPFKETEMKTHNAVCGKNSMDLKKVEKAVESVVNIFEKKIINGVLDKATVMLRGYNNLKISPTRKELKEKLKMEVPSTEGPLGKRSLSSVDRTATKQTSEKQEDERRIKILQNEMRAQKTDNHNNIDKKRIHFVQNEEKENHEEGHKVLMIKGLPKNKRHCEVIYEKFSPFGKIRYIYFGKRSAIVAFADRGTAEIAAKTPDLFKDLGLTLKISTRKEKVLNNEKNVEKIAALHQNIIPLLKDAESLVKFSLNLFAQASRESESLLERKREELVCSTIISAVIENFPQGRCYPFGSRLSGLTLNNSDLDVFLDCGGMYEGFKNTTPSSERKLVNKVAGLLRKKREITQIVVVDRARVPIVSFLHKPTLMHCDLSFKNGLSVQNTLLIKFMVSLDWRVGPLILFLKHWVKLHKLHGPPFFSSYAIAMLVIYYLEQLEYPVLPTIESLQNGHVGRRITIGGWDCSININRSNVPVSQNKDSFPKLLAELFEFYSEFDYQANVISPLTGKLLPREIFSSSEGEKLPMSYKRHILNIPAPIENLVNKKIYICIMDPFDLSHILTKSFTSQGLQIFIQLCKTSAEILKNAMTVSKLHQ